MRYLPERMRQSLFVALQLLAAGRSRNFSQGQCFFLDCLKHGGGNCFEYFLCPIRYDYAVVHFRLRRISASACSSGIGTSPAAVACSYSRTACRSSRSSNSSRSRSYSSMLMTTAIFSPFSLVRNCVGAFMVSPSGKSSAAEHRRQQNTAEDALGLRELDGRSDYSSSEEETFKTARNASCGMSTWPTRFMRRLPSFCFSRSLRLRGMSPPSHLARTF